MSKKLNKTVADFEFSGRKFEIDLLLDSISNGYQSYDIFETTTDKKWEVVGQFTLDEGEYMPSELIEKAKSELNLE